MRLGQQVFPFLWVLLLTSALHAGGFSSTLELTDGKTSQSGKSPSAATQPTIARRVALEASAGEEFKATWKVKRTDTSMAKDVLIGLDDVGIRFRFYPDALDPVLSEF